MATRPLLCAVLAAVMTVAGLGAPGVTGNAAAQEATPTLPPATPGPLPGPEIATTTAGGVPLAPPGADEAGRRQAQAELRAAEKSLKAAAATHKRLTSRLPAIRARQGEIFAAIVELQLRDRAATEALAAARDRVRQLAVTSYVVGGDVPPVDYLLRSNSPTDFMRRSQLVRTATQAKLDTLDAYAAAKQQASDALLAAMAEGDRVNAQARQVEADIDAARHTLETASRDVAHRRQLLDVLTAAAPVGDTDIPRLFLDAYKRAAAALAKRVPHCRVQWPAIAAIGKVEANHGRYRGAQLALNGDVYPRIVGIPLDGTHRTRVIRDTDKGVLDLDTVYDRAVGPMQFIPSTWARVAQDGNGDGVKDANNAYDAALGTAAYLCRAVPSGGLDLEEPLKRAFFSYNRSASYVEHVHTWKVAFDALAPAL